MILTRFLKYAAVFTMVIVFAACGDVNINSLPSLEKPLVQKKPEAKFCTAAPGSQSLETRILFVIDKSGSNVSQNTDPSGLRRYGAIDSFFSKYADNDQLKWGIIEFQIDRANSLFRSPYFRSAAEFAPAIATSQGGLDEGSTPYKAAITEIGAAIRDELLSVSGSVKYNFEIVFLSDGEPRDYGLPIIDDTRILEDVKKLTEISVGFVHFSTVYYNVGGTDGGASNRLKNMASVGMGRFQDASNGEELNFEDLIKFGTEMYTYQIKDFFVYNLNTTLCDDGFIGVDSDSDGLCDKDEDKYNIQLAAQIKANAAYAGKKFEKNKRFSFSPNFSDIFIYRQLMGESLPSCTASEAKLDTDSDLLNNCEEKFLTNYSPMGPNQIWTDEMNLSAKHSSQTNFDSDGDGIIDILEFYFFKEKGLALDFFSIYKNFYGSSQYDLFKNHLSKISPSSSDPYAIDVRHVERTMTGQNCYTFYQETLPLYEVSAVPLFGAGNLNLTHGADENVILVYYILVPENDPTSKGTLMQSYQRIKINSGPESIDLSMGRFTAVEAE